MCRYMRIPKIRDRFALGIVAGLVAAIPGRIANIMEYHFGLTEAMYGHMAAGLFIKDPKKLDGKTDMVGRIANQAMTATTGILTTYLMSATGRDKWLLKGAGIGAGSWLALYGLTSRTNAARVKIERPLTPLLSLLDHMTLGIGSAFLVSQLGDKSIFPKVPSSGQLPLVGGSQPVVKQVH